MKEAVARLTGPRCLLPGGLSARAPRVAEHGGETDGEAVTAPSQQGGACMQEYAEEVMGRLVYTHSGCDP